jgi:hypothetical protein
MLKLSKKKLYHFSSKPEFKWDPRHAAVQMPGFKPAGLWYAPGDAWPKFLTMKGLQHLHRPHVFEVKFNPEAKILRVNDIGGIRVVATMAKDTFMPRNASILWAKLARVYAGIEIIPYVHEARLAMDTEWYYPWDVASGCVWDPTALASVTYVGKYDLPPKPVRR